MCISGIPEKNRPLFSFAGSVICLVDHSPSNWSPTQCMMICTNRDKGRIEVREVEVATSSNDALRQLPAHK